MAPEDLPIFTGTTPKPTVYDAEQPRNHTRKKTQGRGESGKAKKRTPGTHNFCIAHFGVSEWQKSARDTQAQTPRPSGIVFQNPGRCGVPLLGLAKSIYHKGERFQKEATLDIKTHEKPIERFQYTHYTSSHPPGVKRGFIKVEAIRLL